MLHLIIMIGKNGINEKLIPGWLVVNGVRENYFKI